MLLYTRAQYHDLDIEDGQPRVHRVSALQALTRMQRLKIDYLVRSVVLHCVVYLSDGADEAQIDPTVPRTLIAYRSLQLDYMLFSRIYDL